MRVIIQRVKNASCEVKNNIISKIDNGLLLLIGVDITDTVDVFDIMIKKIINLRIFSDDCGKMNLDIKATNGKILAISQFTLYADVRHGNRPSFTNALEYSKAEVLYLEFCKRLSECNIVTEKGIFGADMKISLTNDGPVTIILDSKDLLR